MPETVVSQLAQPDDSDDMEIDSDKTPTSLTLPAYRNRALTSKQERKLVAFLDDLFLQLTRNYKKRSVYIYFFLNLRHQIFNKSFLQFWCFLDIKDTSCLPWSSTASTFTCHSNSTNRSFDRLANSLSSSFYRRCPLCNPRLSTWDFNHYYRYSRNTPRRSWVPWWSWSSLARCSSISGLGSLNGSSCGPRRCSKWWPPDNKSSFQNTVSFEH